MKIKSMITLALMSASLTVQADTPWGMNVVDAWDNFGPMQRLNASESTDGPMVFKVQVFEDNMPNAKEYDLIFDKANGLIAYKFISTDFSEDTFGEIGSRQFGRIKSKLSAIYGKPESSVEQMNFKEHGLELDGFYRCLKTECGEYTTVYDKEGSGAVARLNAIDDKTGSISVFRYSADWTAIKDGLTKENLSYSYK